MHVMTKKQKRLMDKLLQLAGGDIGLVEDAFKGARTEPGEPPTLDEIVYYIMEQRGFTDFVARARRRKGRLSLAS